MSAASMRAGVRRKDGSLDEWAFWDEMFGEVEKRFDPNQRRDDAGRWTDGGASALADDGARNWPPEEREFDQAEADRLAAQYDTPEIRAAREKVRVFVPERDLSSLISQKESQGRAPTPRSKNRDSHSFDGLSQSDRLAHLG